MPMFHVSILSIPMFQEDIKIEFVRSILDLTEGEYVRNVFSTCPYIMY